MLAIQIATGTGAGPTPLAAFDAALLDAGVANYNLLCLSSVIPPASVIRRGTYATPERDYGDRLYVVMARHQTETPGATAWAGLGWTQEPATGRGLFVELHGDDRARIEADVKATLDSMVASRPLRYGEIESAIVGAQCHGDPVCALAIAVYESQPWQRG
jgi:arginine decarboxylase